MRTRVYSLFITLFGGLFIFTSAHAECAAWKLMQPQQAAIIHDANPQLIFTTSHASSLPAETLYIRLQSRIPEGKEIKRIEWRLPVTNKNIIEIYAIDLLQQGRRSKVSLEIQSECASEKISKQSNWFIVEPNNCQLPSGFVMRQEGERLTWPPVVGAQAYEVCFYQSSQPICQRVDQTQSSLKPEAREAAITALCASGRSATHVQFF